MDSLILEAFQKELTCPICMRYFIDPVTIGCGHSFCRPCLYLGCGDILVLAPCYVCKKLTKKRDFKTNVCLKKLACLARRTRLWQFLSSEENTCGAHQEKKMIFCEEDKNLLCLPCSQSQEHEAPRHRSIEWAAEEHRAYINLRREAIRATYEDLPPFRYNEEQHHLEILQKEGKEIFQQLNESKARMAYEKEILRGLYEELKEICHKPDVELLQDFGDVLHRVESMQLNIAQPVIPELSAGPVTGLLDRLHCFRVHVTLSPKRGNSHAFLYGALRSVNIGCSPQSASWSSPAAQCFLAWGVETFTTGRCYWEVDVGDSWNWAFGVCNADWDEDEDAKMDEVEGLFLLGCVKEDPHCAVFTTSPLLLQYVPKPIGRVGVFLDYEGRCVSFVNVAQQSLIHSILSCSFSPRLKPVFCCSHF